MSVVAQRMLVPNVSPKLNPTRERAVTKVAREADVQVSSFYVLLYVLPQFLLVITIRAVPCSQPGLIAGVQFGIH